MLEPSFGAAVINCRHEMPGLELIHKCVHVLRALRDNYGKDAWGRYGFCDAFHPELHWYDPDVLGIDLGIGLLMAENLRTAFVWETFMRNPEPVAAMKACGFHSEIRNSPAEPKTSSPKP